MKSMWKALSPSSVASSVRLTQLFVGRDCRMAALGVGISVWHNWLSTMYSRPGIVPFAGKYINTDITIN